MTDHLFRMARSAKYVSVERMSAMATGPTKRPMLSRSGLRRGQRKAIRQAISEDEDGSGQGTKV
jgi:hypothetical protein